VTATHLADTSAWAQLQRSEVAARLVSLFVGGGAATCGVVDLEVLAGLTAADHAEGLTERGFYPRVPIDDAVLERAVEVQGHLASEDIPVAALVVAAAAEAAGLILLHADPVFERIADVTGQPTEPIP
jgi:predicted nucleic acid-binding protein